MHELDNQQMKKLRLESMNSPVLLLDENSVILDITPLAEKILGCHKGAIIGKQLYELFNKINNNREIFRFNGNQFTLKEKIMKDHTLVTIETDNGQPDHLYEEAPKLFDIISNIDLVIIEFVYYGSNSLKISYISRGIHKLYPSFNTKLLYDHSELLINRVSKEDIDWFWKSLNFAAVENSNWSIEFRIELENNRQQWVEVMAFPTRQDDGSTVFRGNFLFIDKRKHIEKELHFTQSIYRELFNSVEYGICFLDKEMNIVQANPKVYEILGTDEDLLLGKPVNTIEFHSDQTDDLAVPKRINEIMSGGTGQVIDVYNAVSQEMLKVELNYYPVLFKEENMELTGFIFLSDVTDKYQAEKALKESNEIFKFASRAVNEAIWDWNVVEGTLNWGEGLTRIFGYQEREFPKIETWSNFVHWNDYDTVEYSFKKALENKDSNYWNAKYRFLNAKGEYSHVTDNAYILRDSNGLPLRVIGAMRDVSDVMNSAAEKSVLINKALKSEREYISMELHDNLGQYLIALNLYLSNIKTENTELLEKCKELTQQTIKQTRDLCYKITPPELNNGFISAVKGLMENFSYASDIKMLYEIDESITQEDFMFIDEYQNYRIVQEFINNAIKHSKGSQVMCIIYKERGKIYIELSDDGVGFDLGTLTKRGFGLNNMIQRAQMSNSKIELNSVPGKGTRLFIELNNGHLLL